MKTTLVTKIIIAAFLLLTAVSVAATYYKTIVIKDFTIINDVEEGL